MVQLFITQHTAIRATAGLPRIAAMVADRFHITRGAPARLMGVSCGGVSDYFMVPTEFIEKDDDVAPLG